MIQRYLLWMSVCALTAVSAPASAQRDIADEVLTLARQEQDALTILHRLASAAGSAGWCRAQPIPGILLRDVRQFPQAIQGAVRQVLTLSSDSTLYVAAVVPGSAADAEGITPNAAVSEVQSVTVSQAPGNGTRQWLDLAERLLVAREAQALRITGEAGQRSWVGEAGCRADIQVSRTGGRWPVANAERIAVPPTLFTRVGDSGVIASIAHELSHIILEHEAERIDEAGLSRQERLAAAHEREFDADRMAIWLLQRAGYDPETMVALLRLEAEQSGHPDRRYPRHPAWAERVRRAQAALVDMRARLATDPAARPDAAMPLPPGDIRPI